jgi:hypothetical protein
MSRTILAALAGIPLLLAACSSPAEPTSTPAPTATPEATATPTPSTGASAAKPAGAPVPQVATAVSEFDVSLLNETAGRFPPLNAPIIVAASEATWLDSETLILGAVQNGEARAYPIAVMRFHHVSNDILGGEPYLVTF